MVLPIFLCSQVVAVESHLKILLSSENMCPKHLVHEGMSCGVDELFLSSLLTSAPNPLNKM